MSNVCNLGNSLSIRFPKLCVYIYIYTKSSAWLRVLTSKKPKIFFLHPLHEACFYKSTSKLTKIIFC